MDESKVRAIIGRLLDPMRGQEQIAEGATVGEADVVVARYGVPDTNVPHGLAAARVIDRGAFDKLIEGYQARAEKNSIPFFLDHGYAHLHPPFAESNMKIGKTVSLRSEDPGLVGGMQWNLAKESARDAFADAVFDPYGTRFSYRWNDEDTYRGEDGYDHESNVETIVEISQLGLSAAQHDTWVFPESVKMRTSTHHTETTSDGTVGDPPAELPPDLLRMAFAAMDPDADPTMLDTYRFPHHVVDGAKIGAAVIPACEQLVDDLNKMRGMPEDQRVAAYRHAAEHIRDSGGNPEKLRAQVPTIEQFSDMLNDPGFAAEINDLMRASAPDSATGMRRHMGGSLPNGHGKDKDDIAEMSMESLARRHGAIHSGDDAPHSHGQRSEDVSVGELLKVRMGEVITFLLDEKDFRQAFEKALQDAEEAFAVADPNMWYRRTWDARV